MMTDTEPDLIGEVYLLRVELKNEKMFRDEETKALRASLNRQAKVIEEMTTENARLREGIEGLEERVWDERNVHGYANRALLSADLAALLNPPKENNHG